MARDYSASASGALIKLAASGMDGYIEVPSESIPSASGAPMIGTPTQYLVKVLFVSVQESEKSIGDVDRTGKLHTGWRSGDRKALVSATTIQIITVDYWLRVGSDIYDIIGTDPIRPTDTTVLHRLHVRER